MRFSGRFIDLTNRVFSRLTVICRSDESPWGRPYWDCECLCGSKVSVNGRSLRDGKTRSCGCLHRETAAALCSSRKRHGEGAHGKETPEYRAWSSMKARCYSSYKAPYWPNYGGRGIQVCNSWLGPEGYNTFLTDMGRRPSAKHSLDRIDVDSNYSPENCRWATRAEQAVNKRPRTTHAELEELKTRLARYESLYGSLSIEGAEIAYKAKESRRK